MSVLQQQSVTKQRQAKVLHVCTHDKANSVDRRNLAVMQ